MHSVLQGPFHPRDMKFSLACVKIQTAGRLRRAKKKLPRVREHELQLVEQIQGASVIQSRLQGRQAVERTRRKRQAAQARLIAGNCAATTIQSHVRTKFARVHRSQTMSAIKIQAQIRAQQGRRHAVQMMQAQKKVMPLAMTGTVQGRSGWYETLKYEVSDENEMVLQSYVVYFNVPAKKKKPKTRQTVCQDRKGRQTRTTMAGNASSRKTEKQGSARKQVCAQEKQGKQAKQAKQAKQDLPNTFGAPRTIGMEWGRWVPVEGPVSRAEWAGAREITKLRAAVHLVSRRNAILGYGWIGQQSGSDFSDIAGPTLGVFASSDRF
jgi:hypothetical protein